jgi:hypothetical protein
LAFLDEDEFPPDEPASRSRLGGGRQRPYLARRLLGLGAVVLIIILIVLAFRGCLNARKERGFENYARDLASIADESRQLSKEFFDRLNNPPQRQRELDLQAQIAADRSTAQQLLDRVEGLDTPDEMAEAEADLIKSFELRRDGIAGTAEQIDNALGNQGSNDAVDQIARYMRFFLASDVLYELGRGIVQQVSSDEAITIEEIPESRFLPSDEWLDDDFIRDTLAGVTAGSNDVSGVHGLALLGATLNPGGVELVDGGTVTASGGSFRIVAQVQNQGESAETDVAVTYEITGGPETIEGEATISRIAAGDTANAQIDIQPDPPTGTQLTLEIDAVPVPGEQLADNNSMTVTVTFE